MASSRAQIEAVSHVRTRAEATRADARSRIAEVLARSGLPDAAIDTLLPRLRETHVTLSFHPDRLCADGTTVALRLLREGRYRSQFETGVTNGSPTAFAGGDRDGWEEKLFGGAYQASDVGIEERPKYGALNLLHHADGGSPRFGSCYVELRTDVTSRCTLTWGDSHEGPEHVGTIEAMEPLVAVLLETVETTRAALGLSEIDVEALLQFLGDRPRGAVGRALDAYIEAQVHGDIELAADVQSLVIDPSFDGTRCGEHLEEISRHFGISLRRHPGFVLEPGEVPADFRGPRMVPLAERVEAEFATTRGQLDAATLGRAAQSLHRHPETWSNWGTPAETWQHIKQLWHVLVRFGHARP